MNIFPLRIVPDNINFNFVKFRFITYSISIILILFSFFSIYKKSLNFGIDFSGGINIEIEIKNKINISDLRQYIDSLNLGEVVIQNIGDNNNFSIRFSTKKSENSIELVENIKKSLTKYLDENLIYKSVNFVGPQIGKELIKSGIISISLAFLAIMIYVWIRFEWQFGVGVLIALVHDAIISVGMMSVTGLDFNISSVAGILTIIGYSVNDSVVIYDRVRENFRKFGKKTVIEIINISISGTLSRSILTVFTTLLANGCLIIYGGEAIKSFSILVFFGILIGTYSSIFLAAPILSLFKLGKFR